MFRVTQFLNEIPAPTPVGPKRRPHCVARQPEPTRDLLDRNTLTAVQPTNLRPVLQCNHPSSVPEGVSPNPSLEGQSQGVVDNC